VGTRFQVLLHSAHCFFFQAEDGIRDKLVTGVQTCALPISEPTRTYTRHSRESANPGPHAYSLALRPAFARADESLGASAAANRRSEERRVGKECGAGGWPEAD